MNPSHPEPVNHETLESEDPITEALESQNANRVVSLNTLLEKPEFGPLRARLALLCHRLGGDVFFVNPTISHTDIDGDTSVQRFTSPGLQFRDRRSADPAQCHQYVVMRDGSLRNQTKRIIKWGRSLKKNMVLPPRAQLEQVMAASEAAA